MRRNFYFKVLKNPIFQRQMHREREEQKVM